MSDQTLREKIKERAKALRSVGDRLSQQCHEFTSKYYTSMTDQEKARFNELRSEAHLRHFAACELEKLLEENP
jgi:hypothetical protein